MPTSNRNVSFLQKQFQKITAFQEREDIENFSVAVRRLIEMGFEKYQEENDLIWRTKSEFREEE